MRRRSALRELTHSLSLSLSCQQTPGHVETTPWYPHLISSLTQLGRPIYEINNSMQWKAIFLIYLNSFNDNLVNPTFYICTTNCIKRHLGIDI